MLINMLVDFHHFLLFSFSLFYTFNSLFFNLSTLRIFFSLPIHPQEALKNWSIQCKPIALPTKCSIELLVENNNSLVVISLSKVGENEFLPNL